MAHIVLLIHTEVSTYTPDIPTNLFLVYCASELKCHIDNDTILFPNRELLQPGPIVTADGLEEYLVEEIIDSRCRGCGYQFLVR